MKVDFNKPVETVTGRKVRIFTTTAKHAHYPVIGVYEDEDGEEIANEWSIEGKNCYGFNGYSEYDLRNKVDRRLIFKNFDAQDFWAGTFKSTDEAIADIKGEGLKDSFGNRPQGVLGITFEDGMPVCAELTYTYTEEDFK